MLLKNLAKSLRYCFRRFQYERIPSPRAIFTTKALVIAPHPDDETFGVGGLIALKKEKEVPVKVIFFTSGEASHISCCNISKEEVAGVRRKQALEAIGCLGLNSGEILWQDLQDGNIPCEGENGFEDSVRNLGEIFENEKPAEIYCPHPNDGWPDHEATSRIVMQAIKRSGSNARIIYYLVWSWYNARSLGRKFFNWNKAWKLNIEPVFEKKISAIHCYLGGHKVPCGYPYCGKIPWAVINCAKRRTEIFIDGENPN